MIEKFNIEADTDVASILGRTTLIGGTVAGVGLAARQMSGSFNQGSFRRSMAAHAGNVSLGSSRVVNPIEPVSGWRGIIKDIDFMDWGTKSKKYNKFYPTDLEGLLSGGYKGQSVGLYDEVKDLYEALLTDHGSVQMASLGPRNRPDLLRLSAGGINYDIPTVSSEGRITLGENKLTARPVILGTGEVEGMDVALTKAYLSERNRIRRGELAPQDLRRMITDKAIMEESKGRRSSTKIQSAVLQEKRLQEGVFDPFNELRRDESSRMMRELTSKPGYGGGSSSMYNNKIIPLPGSLLSGGLPASEVSISAHQLIRESSFVGAKKPSVNYFKGMSDPGIAQFTVATVKDKEALKRAAKQMGLRFGELAEEEALLNMKTKVGVKNKMNVFTIDTNREQTKFMKNLRRDIYDAGEAAGIDVSKAMTSSGGLEEINLDLNKKLQRLRDREKTIQVELEMLESQRTTAIMRGERGSELRKIKDQIRGRQRGLESIRSAIRDYGILGYTPITGEMKRVPGDDMHNIIKKIALQDGKLTIATESHFRLGAGAKIFSGAGGGGKVTIKDVVDAPSMMALVEQEEMYTARGQSPLSLAERKEDFSKLREYFKDVDLITTEAPVKIKQGVMAPREGMVGAMSYAANILKTGTPEEIKKLERIGITGGEYIAGDLDARQMIQKIRSLHPGKTMEEIFQGEAFLGSKVTELLAAPDISTAQSGFGKLGNISERGAFNLEAMGLGEVLDDFVGRRRSGSAAIAQLAQIDSAEGLLSDFTARGKDIPDNLSDFFQYDLAKRREVMGGERATINLGRRIRGMDKVTIFGADVMQPFVGEQAGGGMSKLDRATQDLLLSVKNQDETFQNAAAKRYQSAMEEVKKNISKSLFGDKITRSMHGQAVSSLEGMEQASRALAKAAGITDVGIPMVALSREEISKFGKNALRQAEAGDFWGIFTREPIEGVSSTLPANIVVAEDFGFKARPGTIHVTGENKAFDILRAGTFVDFDKDPANIIPALKSESKEAIKSFYGVGGRAQTMMGEEGVEALKAMKSFNLKGREPLDILSLGQKELAYINATQKQIEKGLIGPFSNEFKNVHIGLREQLGATPTRAAAKQFYSGDIFSHQFIENILKAKHQTKEALLKNNVSEIIGIFRPQIGTEYEGMNKGQKAAKLQQAFDEITFGNQQIANEVRAADSAMVSEDFAKRMGFADDIAKAKALETEALRSSRIEEILSSATRDKEVYKRVSNISNLENVIEAHKIGREVQRAGDYSSLIGTRNISKMHSSAAFIDDVAKTASTFMTKGLKNVGLYGILPTAAIGLAASLVTKPKVLEPALDTGKLHERDAEYSNAQGQASAGKTLFSIPESKVSSFDIKGTASLNTNFDALRAFSQNKMKDLNVRLHDHRSHMDKHMIEEMIRKGY